jgi:hypothetical protein
MNKGGPLARSLWSYIIFGAPTLLLTKRARLFVTTGTEEKFALAPKLSKL